jgi:hypothetical protein
MIPTFQNRQNNEMALIRALRPFPKWKQWFSSPECPIGEMERLTIKGYDNFENHNLLSKQIGVSLNRLHQVFIHTIRKLPTYKKEYIKWEVNQLLIEQEQLKKLSPKFLNAPLRKHDISDRLYNVLGYVRCKTLNDIIHYRRGEFLALKGVGKKCLNELEELIEWELSKD